MLNKGNVTYGYPVLRSEKSGKSTIDGARHNATPRFLRQIATVTTTFQWFFSGVNNSESCHYFCFCICSSNFYVISSSIHTIGSPHVTKYILNSTVQMSIKYYQNALKYYVNTKSDTFKYNQDGKQSTNSFQNSNFHTYVHNS